ncbi:uncharacterized protein LOC133930276 [Phragmites australis]|uniref:uncharacterized protein LOC133930276 n=1 Tax=Phragmites australis TaxID=29695 RepID=UPI002D76B433|nr:uncharacterized protein LOC133930276 [Phragmites australis]
MAVPQESDNAELRKDGSKASEERASSCYHSSSSEAAMPSSCEEAHERAAGPKQHVDGGAAAAATPPPTQQMDRQSSVDGDEAAAEPGRIPSAVFERDPAESNKDWSMMSTESVFGLQVAPSSDFTGFFLAHPELMDISTPVRTSAADADADATVLAPHFESIPEHPETTMKGNYSFAFPNLIEDKRHSCKKGHQEEEQPATTEAAEATPEPEAQASSKPEAAPEKEAAKGGLLSCFPCCSS